jgi:hypothetical protein
MSRCNHRDRSRCLQSIKPIAMLALDPLQHVVIVSCRQFVSNILFRLGQKNGWAKIWDPKKGFHVFALNFFCPNKFLLDSRDMVES